ncbi:Chaperone SurA [subsurface metagenome]
MAKKKIEKPQREVTKRQLSRWQQQKKRQRIVFIMGSCIIAAVLVVLGVGWYINEYRPLHQIVIKVNDTELDMDYYIKTLKFYGAGQSAIYMYAVADEVVGIIERDELVRQAAMKLGISVSGSEVDEELKDYDSPVSDALREMVRSQLLISKLRDGYFEHRVPVSAEQRHIMAMFLESESQAIEVRDRLEAGEDFGELAGELSLESFTRIEEGDLGWRPEDVLTMLLDTSVPIEYAFGSEARVLSQPIYDETQSKSVGYWLIRVVERKEAGVVAGEEPEQAHIFAILLGSEEEAWQVKEKIETGGDLEAMAKELSQHGVSKDSGGDIGWVYPGTMSSAFEEFAFDHEVIMGKLSEPIKDEEISTRGGYWLVEVLGEDDNRKIDKDDRELLKNEALNEWVLALFKGPENEVTSYLDDEMKRWAADRAYKELE